VLRPDSAGSMTRAEREAELEALINATMKKNGVDASCDSLHFNIDDPLQRPVTIEHEITLGKALSAGVVPTVYEFVGKTVAKWLNEYKAGTPKEARKSHI